MPNLFMGDDTFRFQAIVIGRMVPLGVPGNFALGVKDDNDEFIPKLIGRSDTDLRAELLTRAGNPQYPYFRFALTARKENAFEMECANFHSFSGMLENKTHPVAPAGLNVKCPLCGK